MERKLTSDEIEQVVGFLNDVIGMRDDEQRARLIKNVVKPLREELARVVMNPRDLYRLREELALVYRPIEAGKAVGIITAQSVGETQTQMNLNIFHRAGYRDPQSAGASRLQELTFTSKSKTQCDPRCRIILREGYESHDIFRGLVHMTVRDYLVRVEKRASERDWEQVFHRRFQLDSSVRDLERFVFILDVNLLYRYRLTLARIVEIVAEIYPEWILAYSPLYQGEIIIYAANELYFSITMHSALLNVHLHGIAGIKQAYYLPDETRPNEYYVETEGTNYYEILLLPFVNGYETMTNDMWQIYDLFGIEAVWQFLYEEFSSIMGVVDWRHVELLIDRMTSSGKLRSFTRYTRKAEDRASVLSKITFEETMKGFIDASFKEQIDNVKGCSASIICARNPRLLGAGLCELLFMPEIEPDFGADSARTYTSHNDDWSRNSLLQ